MQFFSQLSKGARTMGARLGNWTWRAAAVGVVAVGSVMTLQTPTIKAADATPTFTKDIAPILQAKCEACHRPDGMAPMSLVTYAEVRPYVTAIAQRVGSRQMPPWHIDKTVGIQKF